MGTCRMSMSKHLDVSQEEIQGPRAGGGAAVPPPAREEDVSSLQKDNLASSFDLNHPLSDGS